MPYAVITGGDGLTRLYCFKETIAVLAATLPALRMNHTILPLWRRTITINCKIRDFSTIRSCDIFCCNNDYENSDEKCNTT